MTQTGIETEATFTIQAKAITTAFLSLLWFCVVFVSGYDGITILGYETQSLSQTIEIALTQSIAVFFIVLFIWVFWWVIVNLTLIIVSFFA